MCGIAGFFQFSEGPAQSQLLKAMTDVMAHRGPDGSGQWISEDGRVGLGHRRLSVIDLSPLGAQPMHSGSGRFVISYNGEIYNFRELREDLEARQFVFRGHSDTEVILAACEEWGPLETLKRLNGMFAIALWDQQEQEFLLARDRVGIKPLFYSLTDKGISFGSELRPLVLYQGSMPPISRQGLTEFLRLGYVPCPLSIFEGIEKLAPGNFIRCKPGHASKPEPYWRYDDVVRAGTENSFSDNRDALQALDQQLRRSVASQMVSDVPLGAFLSGGIDSSTVVALMQAQSGRAVKTFSIGFEEEGYNEAVHAAAVARHLQTDHTELTVTERDAMDVIPQVPAIYDEPFADVSQLPTTLVSRLARQDVTVVLSGDGGDELFAGYYRYAFVSSYWKRLQRMPDALRRLAALGLSTPSVAGWDRFFGYASRVLPASMVPALAGQKAHKAASILPSKSLLQLHVRLVSQWANPQSVLHRNWFHPDVLWQGQLDRNDNLSDALQQSVWDAQTYMVDDILTKVDRATMSVGLEARVPLLDHEAVELAWRIPEHMKLRDGGGKWLLKKLLRNYVPAELIDRPKMGFSVPIDSWLRGSLRSWAEDSLESHRLSEQGYFNPNAIRQTWEQHQTGKVDRGGPLWTALVFQQWLESTKSWL